jgi:Na+-transporting NADH:ubiquinone oxidoreductase subunit C
VHSSKYTLAYAAGLTALIGATLSLAVSGLKPRQERNALLANRRAILQTVAEVDPQTLEQDYQTYITERVFDPEGNEIEGVAAAALNLREEARKPRAEQRLPLYIYRQAGVTRYIIPMQGAGLWGPIGAYLALEADLATIYGVAFSHEKETPGLGAEIDTPMFEDRYKKKRIYRDDGTLEPVAVLRGTGNDTRELPHAVDGLTGATMTLNGVTQMFRVELSRYAKVFAKLRESEEP